MKFKALLSAAFALFSGFAFAQSSPGLSPQAIVVNPAPTSLKVNVAVNKAGANPLYTEGERLQISINVNQDAYVYAFNITSTNEVIVLLPNGFSNGTPLMRANETRTFPGPNDRYTIDVTAPFGQEKIFALASKTPLDLSRVIPQVTSGNFTQATVQGTGLARPLALVVTPLPPQDWTSDYVDFRTQARVVAQTTGTLQVNSNVNGAQIFVDNVLVGNTSVTIPANVGQRSVRVSANGYSDFNQVATVRGGQTTIINANLQSIVQNGTITILTSPADATVFVDNVRIGNGLQTVPVTPGQHTVRVTANGYQDFNTTVNVGSGANITVRATLQAIIQNGVLQINVPNGAQVFINGGSVGTNSGRITVPAGQYAIRVVLNGFQDFNTTVSVQAGQTTVVNANLQPLSGSLVVRSNVANARVFVNGNEVGTIGNDGVLRVDNLPAGNHEVTIVAPGFRTQVQQFSIRAGSITEIFANLARI